MFLIIQVFVDNEGTLTSYLPSQIVSTVLFSDPLILFETFPGRWCSDPRRFHHLGPGDVELHEEELGINRVENSHDICRMYIRYNLFWLIVEVVFCFKYIMVYI